MAGTAVFSYEESPSGKSVELTWILTSDSSGNVSSPTLSQAGCTNSYQPKSPITGTIVRAEIIPGTGSVQPTDLYDVELRSQKDSTIDFLGGLGDNCSQTTTKWDMPITETNGVAVQLVVDQLIPYAANMGDSNQCTIKLLVALEA
ncbi:MAG: hypothetical protein WC593_15010 [Methanoregula sp.]